MLRRQEPAPSGGRLGAPRPYLVAVLTLDPDWVRSLAAWLGLMLATNGEMMDLLRELDPVPIVDHELGTVEIEVPIAPVGLAPALRKLIRIAAQHDVAVPLAHRSGPRSFAAPR